MFTLRSGRTVRNGGDDSSHQDGYQTEVPRSPIQTRGSARDRMDRLDSQSSSLTNTLDSLVPMLNDLKPESAFEVGVTSVLRILVGQLKDFKGEIDQMKNSV